MHLAGGDTQAVVITRPLESLQLPKEALRPGMFAGGGGYESQPGQVSPSFNCHGVCVRHLEMGITHAGPVPEMRRTRRQQIGPRRDVSVEPFHSLLCHGYGRVEVPSPKKVFALCE